MDITLNSTEITVLCYLEDPSYTDQTVIDIVVKTVGNYQPSIVLGTNDDGKPAVAIVPKLAVNMLTVTLIVVGEPGDWRRTIGWNLWQAFDQGLKGLKGRVEKVSIPD